VIGRLSLLVLVGAVAASTAGATPSFVQNGLVAFASDRAENYPYPLVYTIAARGSKHRRVSRVAAWGPPSWAPSGRALVYPSANDIVIAGVNGGPLRRLHVPRLPETRATVAWSPDGRTIAIAEEERPLYLKVLGGSMKRVTRGEAEAPVWSPSGSRIAYVSPPDLLMVVDADGGRRRRLGTWGISKQPSWSPDGASIALADRGIVLVNTHTGRRRRITSRIGDNDPVWSPDGTLIAFRRLVGGSAMDIFVVRADGTGLERLTRSQHPQELPTWSPDSRRLAYTAGTRGDVFVVRRSGGRPTRIARAPCGEDASWLTWSPRGGRLAFGGFNLRPDTELYVSNPESGRTRQVTHNCARWEANPSWSPDGTAIAYDDDDDIFVRQGSRVRRLTTHPARDIDPSWSPDGTRLVFARHVRGGTPEASGYELFTVGAGGGSVRRLTVTAGSNLQPDWSPRGDEIAFVSTHAPSGIYVMHSDGSNSALATAGLVSHPAWSPDASRIAFVRDYDIWTMRPNGSDQLRVTRRDDSTEATDPAWSPDGRWIVFAGDVQSTRTATEYALFVVAATGGPERMLSYGYQDSVEPDWQPVP
jgi:TolB protein